MNMQVLHPRWTNLLENLSALMIILPLGFCAHKQENWLLPVRSVPSPYPYPGAPYSARYLWSPQMIPKHTAWGKHRVAETRFECPHRWGKLSVWKWKFMFNICVCLLLLNWFATVLYQMQITCKCARNHKPKSVGRL